MSASRLLYSTLFASLLGLSVALGVHSQRASAEVVGAKVPPALAAAIKADVEARGYTYGGDCKFDGMYLAPGMWCSFVVSISPDAAEVTYGRFASDDIMKARFGRQGEVRWVNLDTGVGTPARVPLLAARQGREPDSWIISGVDFPANQDVALFDASGCGGEQRCPTDHRVALARAGADGAFEVAVQLEAAAKPVPGQVNRLIQATGGAFIQVPYHHSGTGDASTPPASPTAPATNVPPTAGPTLPADRTPAAPGTGDEGDDSDGTNLALYSIVALFGLVAAIPVGVMVVKRRQ